MSCTPQSLMALAKCFVCPDHKIRQAIQTYLLCQWANKVSVYPDVSGDFVIYPGTTVSGIVDLRGNHQVRHITFPNLVNAASNFTIAVGNDFTDPLTLFTISFPVLQSMKAFFFDVDLATVRAYFPALRTMTGIGNVGTRMPFNLDFPSFQSGQGFLIQNTNAGAIDRLQSFSLPAGWAPLDGSNVALTGLALSAAYVNLMLAICVAEAGFTSGTVDLSGGTSAAPTGQGVTDKATLIARGITVTTN